VAVPEVVGHDHDDVGLLLLRDRRHVCRHQGDEHGRQAEPGSSTRAHTCSSGEFAETVLGAARVSRTHTPSRYCPEGQDAARRPRRVAGHVSVGSFTSIWPCPLTCPLSTTPDITSPTESRLLVAFRRSICKQRARPPQPLVSWPRSIWVNMTHMQPA